MDDEPFFPSYIVYAADGANAHDVVGEGSDQSLSGFGIAAEHSLAEMKAAGECLESICALFHRPSRDKGPVSSQSQTLESSDPRAFRDAFFASLPEHHEVIDHQFGLLEQWPVLNARTGEVSTCPAQLISLSADYASEWQLLSERTSAGLAAGEIGTRRATTAAVLEHVERDSVAAAFSDPERMKPFAALPSAIAELVSYVEGFRLKLLLFDITSDLAVPTVLCMALDETGRGPFLSGGAAACLDFSNALEKAILESVQGRTVLRQHAAEFAALNVKSRQSISCGMDRVAYWWDVARHAELDFCLRRAERDGVDPEPVASVPSCECLLNNLSVKGYEVWLADITLPSIRERGFEVVRALVPGLHRLHHSEANRESYSRHYGNLVWEQHCPPHPIA
ncbi:YcaO-like family protein [Dongia deserti]|uniref:YcaO-like family protein n=1 Tax=Dongia deserti TaxID=2268030 RepID=UPI0013C42482|nr:YcaO-like family protein [Dongia deserti]